MSQPTIRLYGFEEGLAGRISGGFSFADPGFDDLVLLPERHLFCSTMPEVEEIAQMMKAQGLRPFDKQREPIISIGANVGVGANAGVSSIRRQEWNTNLVLRIARAPETAKGLLEDLFDFLLLIRGRTSTKFQIKNVVALARPTVQGLLPNDLCLVTCVLKFFAVPLPN